MENNQAPYFEIKEYQLSKLLAGAAQLGAEAILVQTGHLRPYVSRAEAGRLFGRKNVDHWLKSKQLSLRKDGNYSAACRIDRLEISILAMSEALRKYF